MKMRDFSTRPVWSEDAWLTKHAGETLNVTKDDAMEGEGGDAEKEGDSAPTAGGKVNFNINCKS
jgi:hypothetical protein